MKEEMSKMSTLSQKQNQLLKLFAFELSPIEDIQAKVKSNNTTFYDITFPPVDASAFE